MLKVFFSLRPELLMLPSLLYSLILGAANQSDELQGERDLLPTTYRLGRHFCETGIYAKLLLASAISFYFQI